MTKARWLTTMLVLGLAVVGRPALADWWTELSVPQEHDGMVYWEPRFTGMLELSETAVFDADLTGLVPPRCWLMVVLLRTPVAFSRAAEGP